MDELKDEPRLEFTDKRRVRLDDETGGQTEPAPERPDAAGMAETEMAAPEAPTEQTAGQPAGVAEDLGPAPTDEEMGEGMLPMDVYSLLRSSIQLLSTGAWAWMGLTPSPFSGKMERDLEQAKVAIDAVAALVTQMDPHLDAEERRDLQNLVSMLRVNYVQQVQKG